MKTILTLIAGMIIGYGLSGVLPASELKAKFLAMDMPDMSAGHELNTEAGTKP